MLPDLGPRSGLSPKPADKSAATAHNIVALLPEAEAQQLHSRWAEVQTGFVDEPRQAVQQADELVAEIIRELAETFAAERAQLDRHVGQQCQRLARGELQGLFI